MRVIVTGAAGFLGSHLCDRLLDRGDEVVAVDNLITGRLVNLAHLFGRPGFSFLRHNVSTYVHVPGPVGAVMHFASPASPKDYLELPIQTLKVGSLGTHNMLGLAKDKGARFFLASTSEVYGDPEVHPQTEEYWGHVNPVGPRGVYDEAKRFGEAITMAYHRAHAVDVRIVRIFNVFGPRMRPADGRAVSNLLVQALAGEPLTIYGDGSQTRSFCYVDDEVAGFLALLDCDYVGPVNIGNPEEYTLLELAQMVREVTGSNSEIVFLPLPEDDPTRRRPDISLARRLLGWEPATPLREGLARTAEHFRQVAHATVTALADQPGQVAGAVARVSAVVVNFNAREALLPCVASLRAAGVGEVVVADNASTDGSGPALATADAAARFLPTGANLGYGAAANRGAAAASGDLLLVCNPDLVVEPSSVAALAAALEADPDLAVVAPRLSGRDGAVYPSPRRFPGIGVAVGHGFLGLVAPDNRFTRRYRMLDDDRTRAGDAEWVSGACFLVRRSAWDALGGFDEAYFMYAEDVDLCWRARRAGWRIGFEPAARVVHTQAVSTDLAPYRMIVWHHRSLLRFFRRSCRAVELPLLPLVAAGLAVRAALACGQRRWRDRPGR